MYHLSAKMTGENTSVSKSSPVSQLATVFHNSSQNFPSCEDLSLLGKKKKSNKNGEIRNLSVMNEFGV